MGQIFDFSEIEKSEKTIKKTWAEFRDALVKFFTYDNVDEAKQCKFLKVYDDFKLVDLTIADDISYSELNQQLEDYGQAQMKKGIKRAKALGVIPKCNVDKGELKKLFTRWVVYTYAKLLQSKRNCLWKYGL